MISYITCNTAFRVQRKDYRGTHQNTVHTANQTENESGAEHDSEIQYFFGIVILAAYRPVQFNLP